MNFLNRFSDGVIDELAKRTATTLVGFLVVLAAGVAALFALLPWYVGTAVGVAVLVVAVLLLRILFRRLFVIYPRRSGGHEVLVKHFSYKLEAKGGKWRVTYTRQYKVRARAELTNLREPYLWTGSDNSRPKVKEGPIDVLRVTKETIWKVAELKLHDPMQKGDDPVEFALEWILDDTDGKASPFISAPINEDTRLVKFDLDLPPELGLRTVTLEERRSIDSLSPFSSEKIPLVNGHASWEKKNPPRFYYYCLRWRPGSSRPEL